MKSSNLDSKSRVMLSQEHYAKSRKILVIGFGASLVFHLGLITAIRSWWKPVVNDDAIGITMVEPAGITEVLPSTKTNSATSTAQSAKGNSQSGESSSKPIAVKSDSTFTTLPPKPISKPKQTSPKRVESNIQTSQSNSTTTNQHPPKIVKETIPTPNPPSQIKPPLGDEPKENFIPPSTPTQVISKPTPNKVKKIDRNSKQTDSNRIPTKPIDPNRVTKIDPLATGDSPATNPTSKAGSQQSDPNSSNRSNQSTINNNRSRNTKPESPGSNSTSSADNNKPHPISQDGTNGNSPTSSNTTAGTPGKSSLQCIKNCEITKLQDLEDSDGGKDRLRIRIVVDPNGLVLEASIAKSSGNSQIDSTILEGIKRMQFAPSGKTIKGTVKANIFI